MQIAGFYYDISDQPKDYEFNGKITFKLNNVTIWNDEHGKMDGTKLSEFRNRSDFEIVGTLQSKLNTDFLLKGTIQMGKRLTVDGKSPRHGVKLKQIVVMA